MLFNDSDISKILSAIRFSADKHRTQRRKDVEESAYINHPIEVAETLWRVGQIRDLNIIIAAILHDTLEDTDTKPPEIEDAFGSEVLALVQEVSDDKSLPKQTRKQLQIEHASRISAGAKQIKLADKICNVRDVSQSPPPDWSLQRRMEYLDWASKVVGGLRGANMALESLFANVLNDAKTNLDRAVS